MLNSTKLVNATMKMQGQFWYPGSNNYSRSKATLSLCSSQLQKSKASMKGGAGRRAAV